jgi:tetratricopeptide (TPR) repeat protein
MNRPERDRSRAIHLAHNGRDEARDALLKSYDRETIGAWKATLLRLLSPWAGQDAINSRAAAATKDPDPLVRAAAAYVLGPQRAFADTVAPLLNDPIRAVRFEAVWAMLDHLEGQPTALAEAEAIARHQSDQPGGAARMARLSIHRGDPAGAEPWFRRVLAWDQTAAAPKRDFAVYLAGQGRVGESRKLLLEADKLEPSNPEYPYLLALADAEEGKTAEAEKNLREAIRREPRFARAHYNLGLLLSARGDDVGAIAALREAEKQDPAGADAPYARATIHARLGQNAEAIAAAREALNRRPDYQPALGLLRALGVP